MLDSHNPPWEDDAGLVACCLLLQRAMACHWSQYVWFRRLYVCFSRYLVVNSFRELIDTCGAKKM